MYAAIVLTTPDQPGVTERATAIITELGGNVETSRMVTLGAEFVLALLVEFRGRNDAPPELTGQLETAGFNVEVRPTDKRDHSGQALAYKLQAVGLDSSGIVAGVADTVKNGGGNISEAETELVNLPWSGAPSFSFSAVVTVPDAAGGRRLRDALDELAETLNLDIDLEPLRPV